MGGQGRRRAQEDAFAARYDSPLGRLRRTKKEGASMMGSLADSKNEKFKRVIGASPRDQGLGLQHVGLNGAPDVYREKPGGRRRRR